MTPTTFNQVNGIVECKPLGGYLIELHFSDGYIGKLDLEPAMRGSIFEPLGDTDFFNQVRIEDDTIRWPNGADFCPDVLRFWCEASGVKNQAETDAWFSSR